MTRAFDIAAREYLDGGLWGMDCPVYEGPVHDLTVVPSTVAAARPWIATFHYSRTMPDATKEVFAGYYPGGVLAGFVVYGMGANKAQYTAVVPDVRDGEYRELTRLWSPDGMPKNTESRLIGQSLRMLRGVRLVMSYSDPSQGHRGTIYQATNWLYLGMTDGGERLVDERGQELHSKLLAVYRMRQPERFGEKSGRTIAAELGWTFISNPPKHRYAMLLGSNRYRATLTKSLPIQPYPKSIEAAA